MQARWHFSDSLIGKKVTVEAMPKVCMYMRQYKSNVSLDLSPPT